MGVEIKKGMADHCRSIIKLGVPIVVGQIGVILVGIFDNVMVGRYATDDLAAASFVNSLFNIPIFVGLGFAYGLTPLVGQAFGRKESSLSGALLKNSLLLNLAVGILLSLVMYILWLNIDRMGQPEELLPLIKDYYLLQLFSLPFLMLFNGFKQFSEGINNTKIPMYIMLMANLINIVGNSIFIYGIGPIPDLGVIGAGVSTLISRIAMLLIFVYIFYRSRHFHRYRRAMQFSSYGWLHIKSLSTMGSMIGLQMGMETALFSVTGVMVGWLGKVELASHQILAAVSTIGFMVYYGIGSAVSIRVSNYFGVGDYKNVRLAAKVGRYIILSSAALSSLIFLLARNDIAPLFTSDVEVMSCVNMLIATLIAYQFGDALQVNYSNSLRGISDVKMMALISFIGYFVIAIPTSYICGFIFDLGIKGIWIGYPVGLTIAGLMMWIRFVGRVRR